MALWLILAVSILFFLAAAWLVGEWLCGSPLLGDLDRRARRRAAGMPHTRRA